MASTLNLRNSNWQAGCRTEVHIGNNVDPNLNHSEGVRVVAHGQSWTIVMTQNVQWRREADPDHPQGDWGPWNEQAYLIDNQTYDVDL